MKSPGRHLTERELFDQAAELPREEVAEFLESACEDPALRARVAALVDSSAMASGVLPDEPSNWPGDWERSTGGEEPGQVIGRYRLEKVIGQGGFGVVWLAWQEEPVQRKVALKILKMGLDTRAVVARFAAERQALAMMDHPNVAHVYDAGSTPAGRPYFVMEYLEGETLFGYAAARKLTVAERLRLIMPAASAVQHAHQKGIIHRDLKPSNIIVVEVDGVPVPKIIDFGIAKVVSAEPGADLTMAGQHWGTPAYMSPEQIAGTPVDTRSDVYSFGVILFELLTGARPATRANDADADSLTPSRSVMQLALAEAQMAAAERSTTPRELTGLLRGELDWIVMKATATDPAQRYDSAGGLRDDLVRFEAGEPVSAGPPGAWYRAGKFIRRNKVKIAAAAAAALALVAGTVVSLVYARRAHEATVVMSAALFDARITEARAVRQSGRPGQRLQALASVEAAAKLRPTPELRDEALAAMMLPDISPVASLDVIPEISPVVDYDFASDLLVVGRHDSVEILQYRLTTGQALGPVPLPLRLTGSYKFCLNRGGTVLAVYPVPIFDAVSFGDELTFYEIPSGRKLCVVPGADFECDGCEFFPPGDRAVIPMDDGELSVMNVRTGAEERRIRTGGRVNQVRLSDDARRLLASRSGQRLSLLIDTATGSIIQPLVTHGSGVVADFSPDGRLAAFGDGAGALVTMDLLAGKDPGGVPFVDLVGHRGALTSVDFVLDGQFVVSAGWDHTVRLWGAGGQQVMVMEAGRVMAAPDGKRLMVWQGKRVQLLELIAPGENFVVSQTSAIDYGRTAFSPDGKFAAMRVSGGTLILSLPKWQALGRFEGSHKAIAFDPGSGNLLTSGNRGVCAWEMATLPPDGPVRSVIADEATVLVEGAGAEAVVSADGRWIAQTRGHGLEMNQRKIEVFSLPQGKAAASLPWINAAGVGSMVFDPAGEWLAVSWWRGSGFTVWDSSEWKNIITREPEVESLHLTVSDDGRMLVSCSPSELCLWDTNGWQPVLRIPYEPVSAAPRQVAVAPGGELAAFECEPSRIRLFRPENGATVATLTLPLRDSIHHLVFSRDGNSLAVATAARTWFIDLPRMSGHLSRLGLRPGP